MKQSFKIIHFALLTVLLAAYMTGIMVVIFWRWQSRDLANGILEALLIALMSVFVAVGIGALIRYWTFDDYGAGVRDWLLWGVLGAVGLYVIRGVGNPILAIVAVVIAYAGYRFAFRANYFWFALLSAVVVASSLVLLDPINDVQPNAVARAVWLEQIIPFILLVIVGAVGIAWVISEWERKGCYAHVAVDSGNNDVLIRRDGQKIFAVSPNTISSIDVSTNEATVIFETPHEDVFLNEAMLSPDETMITFTTTDESNADVRSRVLWVIRASDGAVRFNTMLESRGDDIYPRFRLDNQTVLFDNQLWSTADGTAFGTVSDIDQSQYQAHPFNRFQAGNITLHGDFNIIGTNFALTIARSMRGNDSQQILNIQTPAKGLTGRKINFSAQGALVALTSIDPHWYNTMRVDVWNTTDGALRQTISFHRPYSVSDAVPSEALNSVVIAVGDVVQLYRLR